MNEDQFNPLTLVIGQLNKRLAAIPFKPFDIVMSNGARHVVPTPDHITITRLLRRIEIETDALNMAEINPLHVASIEDHQDAA
jgi:hypothetical protein